MYKLRYGDKKSLAILTVSLLISAGLGGITLYALRFIMDYAVSGEVSKLIETSKILFVVLVFELVFNLISSYLKSVYLNKSMLSLRNTYVGRLFNLDIRNLNKNSEEKYLSHLSNDMDRYEARFYLNIIELIDVVGHLLVSMFLLATIDTKLLLLTLVLLVFFVVVSKQTSKPIKEKEQAKSKSLQLYTNYIVETLKGFFVIKQNNLETTRIKKFNKLAQQVQDDNYEVDKKSTNIDGFNQFVQILIIFILVFTGLYFAKKFGLSLGMTMLAGTAFSNSIWPMQKITPYISEMSGISIVLSEFEEVLNKEETIENIDINEIETILFEKTDLGYNDTTILNDVNIEINKNQKVLIMGTSGAGKSTILKSIRRQLPLKSGDILINNHKLKYISADTYFRQMSVVDQIGFIFNSNLKNNITLYKEEDEDKLNEILLEVGLDDLNLDYKLKNNGANISGGQRARLLLARALYLDTSLIICDEIFASLDHNIGESIERKILTINKTVINVSHIIFEENINLYDIIYLVEEHKVTKVNNFQEIKDLGLFLN